MINFTAMKTVLLLTRIESPAFRAMRDAILPLAKNRGWAVHVLSAATFVHATSLVKAWAPNGCLVYAAPPSGISGRFGSWRHPVVTLNATCPIRGITGIAHDSAATGELAARELLSLNLDNFAFFSTVVRKPWVNARYKSFAAEIARYGREVTRCQDGRLGDWIASLPRPCGLFAANDIAAERIVSEAFARKIAIPEEIALVGCDDNPQICEHAETTISSIRVDFLKCARLAVEALSCAMDGRPYEGETVYGDIGVTRRASTRRIMGRSALVSKMLEHIRLNALSGIGVSDAVERFGISRRTAEYRMRRATGRSMLEEIQSVRLVEAQRLLADPSVKLGSIASRVGYSSENFFERLFKRTSGMTMKEARRQLRQQT